MKLTHLRAFHAVAAAGGFIAGAAKLNVSQPTLTAQVANIESEFGVELFYRRTGAPSSHRPAVSSSR